MAAQTLYDRLFHAALRIRLVEERIIDLYPSDKIQSPVHLSIGQEAVAVGVCESLELSDLLFASYRGHAFYMAKGGDLNAMFAELYGKATGCGGGKAGSMHLSAPEVGMMGSSAVVASTIPHAVGAALAAKRRRTGQVIVAAYGDGATEEGAYHESLNLAALWQVPVLLVCEDNGLAVHSRPEARQAFDPVALAQGYGIKTRVVEDGADFVAVHEATEEAVRHIRETGEPFYLHVKTFRYREHVGPGEDFTAGYRDRSELDAWMRHDPLVTDVESVEAARDAIAVEITAAVAFAEESPWPGLAELLVDVK